MDSDHPVPQKIWASFKSCCSTTLSTLHVPCTPMTAPDATTYAATPPPPATLRLVSDVWAIQGQPPVTSIVAQLEDSSTIVNVCH